MSEITYARRGNGTAVHIAYVYGDSVGTLCDHWATNYKGQTARRIKADSATCKKCLAIAAPATAAPDYSAPIPAPVDRPLSGGSIKPPETTEEYNARMNEYQRNARQLRALRMAWRHHEEAAAAAKAELAAYVRDVAAGQMSEYTLATELGVTRQTVRAWLGK